MLLDSNNPGLKNFLKTKDTLFRRHPCRRWSQEKSWSYCVELLGKFLNSGGRQVFFISSFCFILPEFECIGWSYSSCFGIIRERSRKSEGLWPWHFEPLTELTLKLLTQTVSYITKIHSCVFNPLYCSLASCWTQFQTHTITPLYFKKGFDRQCLFIHHCIFKSNRHCVSSQW